MEFEEIRAKQLLFEDNLVGTDGSLTEHNDLETILTRGVIGESMEAIAALREYGELSEEFRDEVCDVWVFFASLLNHAGMSMEEVAERANRIVVKNFIKYRPENFEGRTVDDGISKSREDFLR